MNTVDWDLKIGIWIGGRYMEQFSNLLQASVQEGIPTGTVKQIGIQIARDLRFLGVGDLVAACSDRKDKNLQKVKIDKALLHLKKRIKT